MKKITPVTLKKRESKQLVKDKAMPSLEKKFCKAY